MSFAIPRTYIGSDRNKVCNYLPINELDSYTILVKDRFVSNYFVRKPLTRNLKVYFICYPKALVYLSPIRYISYYILINSVLSNFCKAN